MPTVRVKMWTMTVKNWDLFDNMEKLERIGNYQDEDGQYLVRYLSIGKHTGTKTGYQHCHINLELEKRQYMTWVKSVLFNIPDMHCEKREGSREDCDNYLAKDGEFKVIVNRRRIERGHRSDLDDIHDMIKEGKDLFDVYEAHFASTVRYSSGLEKYIVLHDSKRARELETAAPQVIVYVGPAGSGKSWHCFNDEDYKESGYRFPIQMYEKVYFDGYNREKTIWFDEFNGRSMPFGKFCQLADRFPGIYETKGGSVLISGLKKILISTISYPATWWAGSNRFNLDPEQLYRRLTKCYYLGPPRTTADGVREYAIPLEFNPRELLTREQEEILKRHVKYPSDLQPDDSILDID